MTGKTGIVPLKATLLTKNGVVLRAETQVTIYTPYDGMTIKDRNLNELYDETIEVGKVISLHAVTWTYAPDDEEKALGNVTESGAFVAGDKIGEYVWTVVDWSGRGIYDPYVPYTDIVSLEPDHFGSTCYVKGLSEGWVTIQVTGYSAYDNTAFTSVEVTINVTETGA